VGFSSREVRRAIGQIQLSDSPARHGAYEPPSSTVPKFGGCHRDGEVYRLSVYGVSQPEIALLRRPEVDFIAERSEVLVAATPMNQSGVLVRASLDALDRQD
jgi:hypothetical protein